MRLQVLTALGLTKLCVLGSHGGEHEDDTPGCDTVYTRL
jgi:hypothetical protein